MTSLDLVPSDSEGIDTVVGSILDRSLVRDLVSTSDVIVHIAAWHGYHAFTRSKSEEEFWDVNMTGTFNILEACARHKKRKFIFISSTSVDEWPEMYGMTKALGEDLCRAYAVRDEMQTLALRPRAFIPWWNTQVYKSKAEWAAWFARGAVHIEDVTTAVVSACQKVLEVDKAWFEAIELDGRHDFDELEKGEWREQGRIPFLVNRFPGLASTIVDTTFLPSEPPSYKDLTKARDLLAYEPRYGYEEMLRELSPKRD
jgi:nucleoside-diphosphate-sugar epimerase